MASEDPKMSKQHTAGKRKHTSLTIPQKPDIIRKLESGKNRRVIMVSYNISSPICDIKKQKQTNCDHL
jgi:hypothetical protein